MTDQFRILVTGSRTWNDTRTIDEALDQYHARLGADMILVHGACPRGADAIADSWARHRGVQVERHPADWKAHGRTAGHRRNADMIATRPNLVLAFIRDNSPGATGCVRLAERAGIAVQGWDW
jgi:hypothetical protein